MTGEGVAMGESKVLRVQPTGGSLQGRATVPGDKSLSHRAVLLGMLAEGQTKIRGWLAAGDTEATLAACRALGVPIERQGDEIRLQGGALREPTESLDLRNAGTGFRLLAGILAGQDFASTLDGSAQLRRRPMARIIQPLHTMGANIHALGDVAPLKIRPARLHGIFYHLPVASAQVKSAVLLAGLFAYGATAVEEPQATRDHTERMLASMGADLVRGQGIVVLQSGQELRPLDLRVPGDFSSAAFPLVAATLLPGSDITLTGVNLNPTRTGLLDALGEMGADLQVSITGEEAGEPVGELRVRSATLQGAELGGALIPRMIDEIPLLMVAATQAVGKTRLREAAELRVKESDRLAVMAAALQQMGAVLEEREDGFVMSGPQGLRGAQLNCHDDHRIAMSLAIAGMLAEGDTTLLGAECTNDSFPGFAPLMSGLGAGMQEAAGPESAAT
ncbi:MAG: 3-phosphoshikimate 1-carboxyvinyltransferase [Chloroflexi bacterium]|nr:3-phosphoshikimate 1-carboxyvinyltransferase [Chloroflexota bacterium]